MARSIPPSACSPSHAARCGEMVHIVVKRLGNGVDCLGTIERVPRALTFPERTRLLDLEDVRVRDLVALAFDRAGIEIPPDPVVVGCAYDVGDETHKFAWICEKAGEEARPGVMDRILSNKSARRAFYASLLIAMYLLPSPVEWGMVIAGAAPMVRMLKSPFCDTIDMTGQ